MLKKFASILLICLFLFNWVGYRLLTYYMEQNADVQLQTRLDNEDYEASQLVSIKIPVTHLAYYQNSQAFEVAAGKIEIHGIVYQYVKRRIYNDSLEVLCIPNHGAMQVQAVKNNFFLSVNGIQHTGMDQGKKQSANAGISRDFSSEYCTTADMLVPGAFYLTPFKRYTGFLSTLYSIDALTPEQPPEGFVS